MTTTPPPPVVLLAADDVQLLRQLIVHFPRDLYTPMAARSGQYASHGVAGHPLALAVVHESLNDMPGLDLCNWLRQAGDIAVIYLTSGLPPRNPQDPPYDRALKFPSPNIAVFQDAIQTLIRERSQPGGALEALVRDIQARVDAIDSQDYYTILGVSRTASQDAIVNSYDKLSIQYHPDQHFALRKRPEGELLNTLYKRIGEAYRILSDTDRRALYNKGLAKGVLRLDPTVREKEGPKSLEDLSDNPRVKRFLKLAQSALGSGNARSALQNLRFAQSLDRDNDDIKAKIEELQAQA